MASEKVRVRPMEVRDIRSVLEIDHKLNGVQSATTYIGPADKVLGGQSNLNFVAEAGDRCVGFVLARIARVGNPAVETVVIQVLGVDPAYQRRSVATELVNSLVKTCRSRNLGTVRIMLRGRDSQLHSFFERMDFLRGEATEYTKTIKKA